MGLSCRPQLVYMLYLGSICTATLARLRAEHGGTTGLNGQPGTMLQIAQLASAPTHFALPMSWIVCLKIPEALPWLASNVPSNAIVALMRSHCKCE